MGPIRALRFFDSVSRPFGRGFARAVAIRLDDVDVVGYAVGRSPGNLHQFTPKSFLDRSAV
ncbi:hypothetical protein CO660_10370 [Rhizobium sp. L9]|nr:hypothetical protein CO660_10370 [Rhizobium sp. L9]